jgi:hypothetical protein
MRHAATPSPPSRPKQLNEMAKVYEPIKISADAAKASADAAADATNISRTALVATTRPWIEPTRIEITSLAIINNELIINISVHYLNVGHSPAQSVDIRASISAWGTGIDKAAAECLRDPPTEGSRSAQSVFPGQSDVALANLHIKNLDALTLNGNVQRFATVAIAGCIIYTFEGSEGYHHTTFMGTVWRKRERPARGNEGGTGIDVLAQGSISPNDLDAQIISIGTSAN